MLKEVDEYHAGIGAIVYDEKGKEHSIKHYDVATQPNDSAMEYIAGKHIEIGGIK